METENERDTLSGVEKNTDDEITEFLEDWLSKHDPDLLISELERICGNLHDPADDADESGDFGGNADNDEGEDEVGESELLAELDNVQIDEETEMDMIPDIVILSGSQAQNQDATCIGSPLDDKPTVSRLVSDDNVDIDNAPPPPDEPYPDNLDSPPMGNDDSDSPNNDFVSPSYLPADVPFGSPNCTALFSPPQNAFSPPSFDHDRTTPGPNRDPTAGAMVLHSSAATSPVSSPWLKIDLRQAQDVVIRSQQYGTFIHVSSDGHVSAHESSSSSCTFMVEKRGNEYVTFYSARRRCYLSAGSSGGIECSAEISNHRSRFVVEKREDNLVAIKSRHSKHYLGVQEDGRVITQPYIKNNCIFHVGHIIIIPLFDD